MTTGAKLRLGEVPTQALVIAARDQKVEAQSKLYHRFYGVVRSWVLSRVRYGEAEDIVQATFESAFEKIADIRNPAKFAGWLKSIAINKCNAHGRQNERDKRLPATEEAHDPHLAASLDIRRALAQLPPDYTELLVMRFVQGLSGPEIAERTGLTPGSVRVKLVRGKAKLREIYGADRDC